MIANHNKTSVQRYQNFEDDAGDYSNEVQVYVSVLFSCMGCVDIVSPPPFWCGVCE